MGRIICLLLISLLCKTSTCERNVKKRSNNQLMGFLLQQMTSFGTKLEKLSDDGLERIKEMHQVEKSLIKSVGDLKSKLEKNDKRLNMLKKFNNEKQKEMDNLSEKVTKIKSVTIANENNVNHLSSSLKKQKKDYESRSNKIDNRINSLQRQIEKAMKKAAESRPGCQSGSYGKHAFPQVLFPTQTYIRFNPPFTHTPAVSYGLSLLDSSKDQNVRVITDVSSVSKAGFTLRIRTFGNTVMWGAHVSWMACPKNL